MSSSHHQHSNSTSDHHRHHSNSTSDHHHKHKHHHKNQNCFAFDARRNTFGSENITLVGTTTVTNRTELARVFVPCNGTVKIDGVVGWQATADASGNRVPVLFEIFRNVVDSNNLIFSTLDSAAIIDNTDVGARFVTTAFTTVDARFPFAGGSAMSGIGNIPGFPFQPGATYILTARAVEPGDRAVITGPVVLEAEVERRRNESSSSDHRRRRRRRCKPCKCVCKRKCRKRRKC
ncbi:hypothetical protein [Brevibacillus fluminis]|uniref:hypothetical protein n=1 Tax=Brevibacillus fluminis TaxID=511487 RepID=UPI0011CE4599|nr:hypothetical protein [Brevibacillus fluminis]